MSHPMHQPLAYIPSPAHGVWHLFGFIPIRGYAIMIILGVVVAVWLGEKRWIARGGEPGTIVDIAVWAVPFGLVGARLYHVITDYELYFDKGKDPFNALRVWDGGLGIWGGIALGTLGAYIACRRRGASLLAVADACAPGIVLAQAIGRWGNWFNQELYGRPSTLPWAVEIDQGHRLLTPDLGTYQPTFLYESLWCIGVAILVIWAERRFKLTYGRAFALYVAAYTVGRAWIEWLRVDTAHHILGLRLNDWTCLIVFIGAVAYMYVTRDKVLDGPIQVDPTVAPAVPEAAASEPSEEEPESEEAAEPSDVVEPDEESEESAEAEASDSTEETAADEEIVSGEHSGTAVEGKP
jgi:prolipoprotein diacylglyceryl transferase